MGQTLLLQCRNYCSTYSERGGKRKASTIDVIERTAKDSSGINQCLPRISSQWQVPVLKFMYVDFIIF